MERLGYVKLYRKLLDSVIWDNEKALKVWIWCLLKANHQDRIVLLGRQRISIKSGEFVFGSLKAKNELKMAISTIWYYLNFFKSESQVEIKTTNKYSIITILNWKSYQAVENKVESKKKAKLKTNRKQIGNKVETNKNVLKNDKNEKNIISYTPKDLELSKLLYELIKENNPAWYVKPNWDNWADDIRKLREIDGRTYEQIEFMIRWTQQDYFWRQNILSPAKLRKQFNNLVVKAKQSKNKGRQIII